MKTPFFNKTQNITINVPWKRRFTYFTMKGVTSHTKPWQRSIANYASIHSFLLIKDSYRDTKCFKFLHQPWWSKSESFFCAFSEWSLVSSSLLQVGDRVWDFDACSSSCEAIISAFLMMVKCREENSRESPVRLYRRFETWCSEPEAADS